MVKTRKWRARMTGGVCVGLLLAIGSGCANVSVQGDSSSRIVARPALDPPDVPIPSGFKPVEEKSSDQSSGAIRSVWHEYRGRMDRAALRNFYRDQMPSYRWGLISDQNVKGEVSLRFEKGDEECVVMIRPAGGILDETLIRVVITHIDRNGQRPPARN